MPLISLFTSNFKPIGNSFREMGPDAPLNDFEYVILPNNDLTYIFIPDNDLFNTFIADNDIQYILLPDNDINNTVIPSNNVIYTIIPNGDGTYTLIPNNDLTYSLLQPSPSPTPSVTPTVTPTMSVTPTATPTSTITPTPTPTPSPIPSANKIVDLNINDLISYVGSGSTVVDLMGNTNASLVGSPIYQTVGCNSSIVLNGTNQYIITNTSIATLYDSSETSVFLWVYLTDNGVILTEQGTGSLNAGWHDSQIELVGGTLKFSVWPYGSTITSSISTPLNNWYYIGFVYGRSTLTAYVNGQSAGSVNIIRETPYQNASGLFYAVGAQDSTNLGDGTYSALKFGRLEIWDGEILSSNVLQNYNNSVSTWVCPTPTPSITSTVTPTNTITPTSTPVSGLVTSGLVIQLDAYDSLSYPGTGTTVYDITSGYNHTLVDANYTVRNGIKCFDCTTDTKRVVVNGTGPLLPNSGYTYITWTRLMTNTADYRTLLYTNSPRYTPITIPNASNTLGYWDTSFKSSGYDVASSAGVWVQFAIVGTNTSQTFYINGSQVGSSISTGAGGTTHWGWGNNDTVGQPWGHVANMYFYNRQLNLAEITQQYNYLAPRFVELTPTPTPTPTTTVTPTNTITPTHSVTPSVTPTPSTTPPSNFTVTISESGSDVIWSSSGTINTTSLTDRGTTTSTAGYNGAMNIWGMGSLTGAFVRKYDVVFTSSSGNYGTIGGTPNSSSGDFVGVLPGTATDKSIQVPNGYVSGTYLSNTSTFTNKTITSMGLTPGTYVYTWGSGANAGSITVVIPVSTATPTPTPTSTKTPTPTLTNTPSITPTNSITPTMSVTPTNSVTPTMSMTPTPSATSGGLTTSNLILLYVPSNPSSYPGTGTTITDLSGNGRNGTMSNISYTSPYFTYNGTSSQISVADNALLEPTTGDWTMEVWVNQSVAGNDVVLGKFNAGGLTQNVGYSIRTTSSTFYGQYSSGSGSGATLFVNSTNHVATIGTWYQLVYVFTNVAANTLQTFVNGTSIGSVSHSLGTILNTSTNLYIGSYNNGEYAQWFDGKIGIVRLYNKALTSSEVLNNYNNDISKYIPVTPTPTSTTTPTPTITPTNTVTPTASVTPTMSVTPTSTVTPTMSVTPTRTLTPTPSTSPIVVPGLQFYLQSAPSSGAVWTDASGKGKNATINGSYSYVSNNGGGIKLNNTDYNGTGYITVPYNISGTTSTIEIVASFNPTSYWATIWGNEAYSFSRGYFAYMGTSTSLIWGSPTSNITTATITASNSIRHWVFVIDGTSKSLYLNGSLLGSTVTLNNPNGGYATGDFYFGARHTNVGTGASDKLNSNVSGNEPVFYQMRVYNTALNSSEVTTNFNEIKTTYGL
jgi:hypothetical protein